MSNFTGKQNSTYMSFSVSGKKGLPALADILRQVTEEMTEIDAAIDKASLDQGFPKIQKVTVIKAELKEVARYDPNYSYSYADKYNPRWQQVVDAASKHLQEVRAQVEATHAANIPAMVSNEALYVRLRTLMLEVGMPSTTWEPGKGRKNGQSVTAGWLRDLGSSITREDRHAYAVRELADQENRIKQYAENQGWLHREATRKQEKEAQKVTREREIGMLAARYGLNVMAADKNDVMEAILAADKYLALAHAFYGIRYDYNDSPHKRGRRALDRFTVETDMDRQIMDHWLETIQHQEENGESDGRIYRDSDWNYETLYGLVKNAELLADYQRVRDMLAEDIF